MQQQALSLLVASPLSVSAFAAGLGALQIRSRLQTLPEVLTVASVQYRFNDDSATLRTNLCIRTDGMETTLHFIEATEILVREWLGAVGISVSHLELTLPES